MNILNLLRSVPDDVTRQLMTGYTGEGKSEVIKLYEPDIDWEQTIDTIFKADRIVCWW